MCIPSVFSPKTRSEPADGTPPIAESKAGASENIGSPQRISTFAS